MSSNPKDSLKSMKIGLALGGGGVRGLAHIGVLKVLQREHIPIDFIAGTSMGGIIGALLAAGVSVEDMETEALRVRSRRQTVKLLDLGFSSSGLIKGAGIHRYMSNLLGAELTFDDLLTPLALVAVDIHSGREVILREGKVVDALRATISVPVIRQQCFNP